MMTPSSPQAATSAATTAARAGSIDDLKITLISLHGLIRARDPELGRDADTGGQVKYVLELAREFAQQPNVREVELLTRQIVDPKVSDDYAQVEEAIAPKAKIVRIPFGPRRYLRKESLWPYIEMFIDQTLVHFKRSGLPNIIHGHYADAGLAGAQLARLLHIPFIFTGHSLGRVKRQRLSLGKADTETLEKRYKFHTRIEAEEIALETAAMVVTSTNQEVQQQYALYDHYVPSRMEVIPPGVDLSSFSPTTDDWSLPPIADQLARFLREPDKPIILTMARPDERKNLEMLVKVYGESEQLQKLANLVMIMGARDDLRELPKGQQAVINNVLHLIDRYDLYGKVAYPKAHAPNEVPEIYRLAELLKGVFINPALTEPFGLTLLEAGATGLPIVATNDGGPRDIIANCRNGLLVDPLDRQEIEHALLRVLTEPEQWTEWSANGIKGTREHYSWQKHVKRYLRDVTDILDHATAPVLRERTRTKRIPEFDRLIVTDLDNTLTGDDQALAELIDLLQQHDHVGFGIATGRRLDSAMSLIDELGLPRPDLIDTDCGTQIHYGDDLTPDLSWRKSIGYAWLPDEIRKVLDELPGFYPQDDEHQSQYKISYDLDTEVSPSTVKIKKILREAGLRAKVILSLNMYLDVIPVRGGSDLSMRHVLWKWGFAPEHVLVAGDSGNDAGMLLGRTLGVVVANHSHELDRLRNRPRIYFAQKPHAAGILEGIEYYNFLEKISIPNDRIE
jgi:sucrose-phosphate synthase